MLKFKVTPASKKSYSWNATKPRVTVGRSPRNDLFLDDQFASRLHAALRTEEDGGCSIHDLGSANGTFVNGTTIEGSITIRPGDRIQVGSTLLELLPTAERQSSQGSLKPETVITHLLGSDTAQEPSVSESRVFSVLEAVRHATGGRPPEKEDTAERAAGQERRGDLFEVMTQVGLALLSSTALDEVLQKLIELIFDAVPADRAFLLLRQGEDLVCKAASDRSGDAQGDPRVRLNDSVHQLVLGQGQSVLTSDAQEDERFRGRDSIILSGVRSVMAVPLAVGGERLGLIYVDNPLSTRAFTRDDLHLLTTIGSVAAIRIENALLLEQRLVTERLKQQLAKARDIQTRLLPEHPPQIPGYDLTGVSFPCFEVGGDYFDFMPLAENRLLIALGDVSGKGIDAAILMSSLHAAVRVQALAVAGAPSLVALVEHINNYLYTTTPANKFITFFVASLDSTSHQLRFVNAGHNAPLVVRSDGRAEELSASGPPLGIVSQASYRQGEVDLAPGDVLAVFSDGVPEATAGGAALEEATEFFGEERLAAVIHRHRGKTAAQLRDRIEEALLDFVGVGVAPEDDVTLVILKRH